MATTGLFVVTNPKKVVTSVLKLINQNVRKTLYIHLLPYNYSQQQKPVPEEWRERLIPQLPNLCKTVMNLYANVSATCPELDTCVLLAPLKNSDFKRIRTTKKVDVIIFDSGFKNDDINLFMKSYASNASQNCKVILVPQVGVLEPTCYGESVQNKANLMEPRTVNKIHDFVVIGGTFDRLHNGHKILLSEASLRCSKKLTIGVTDASMVKSKILSELIETCDKRIQSVKRFVEDMDSSIEYNIVPIDDPFGPTKSDAALQLIVVSGETYRGGLKVNELRKSKNLPLLEIHEVPLLQNECKQSSEEEEKMSSSALRMRLLGKMLKIPEPQPRIPLLAAGEKVPYIVGLTGGIASGKSSVGDRLEKLGASVVNCDLLGHQVYEKGQVCYDNLLKTFGLEIIGADGQINRHSLGKIVFGDKEKLMTLNSLVWPHIVKRIKDSVHALAGEGKRVVIIEAAVLLKANWDAYCNEVWTCIIPKDEAMRRLQERTGLEQSECEKRVLSQIENSEAVAAANVVISTLWSGDYTQKQVERAWEELQSRVNHWMNNQPTSNL